MNRPSVPSAVAQGGYFNEKRVEIRWRDLDPLGHVHHGQYLTLLEVGRDAFLQEAIPGFGLDEFVVARCAINYRKEINLETGYVRVLCKLGAIGGSSMTLMQELLLPDGEVAADAEVVLVLWDSAAGRSRSLRNAEREALMRALDPGLESSSESGPRS